MPHKRSREAQRRRLFEAQVRAAAHIVSKESHRDRERAESVNLLEPRQVLAALREQFESVFVGAVQNWERGEVISDSLGRGTQQRVTS